MCPEPPKRSKAPQQTPVNDKQNLRSQLFMVRVWLEDLGHGESEWRWQVKHVLSGEMRYFREWSALVMYLNAMLPKADPATDAEDR